MKTTFALLILLTPIFSFASSDKSTEAKKKLSEDPTKVTTTLGVRYGNNYSLDDSGFTLSGSLALDPARKINVSVNEDGSEWRVGGSWLFDLGIVNFNFGRRDFSTGAVQDNYSIGTFLPLSYLGFEPYGIQIFPMAGYSYIDGEQICEVSSNICPNDNRPTLDPNFVLVNSSAHSGYIGAFALKPLAESLTLIMMSGGALGSNNYSGYWFGGGIGYTLLEKHSINAFTYKMDNSYGSDTAFSVSYSYEF